MLARVFCNQFLMYATDVGGHFFHFLCLVIQLKVLFHATYSCSFELTEIYWDLGGRWNVCGLFFEYFYGESKRKFFKGFLVFTLNILGALH